MAVHPRSEYSCPKCPGYGEPVSVACMNGSTIVSIQCVACGANWTVTQQPEPSGKTA
jgi:hypothetical protein